MKNRNLLLTLLCLLLLAGLGCKDSPEAAARRTFANDREVEELLSSISQFSRADMSETAYVTTEGANSEILKVSYTTSSYFAPSYTVVEGVQDRAVALGFEKIVIKTTDAISIFDLKTGKYVK